MPNVVYEEGFLLHLAWHTHMATVTFATYTHTRQASKFFYSYQISTVTYLVPVIGDLRKVQSFRELHQIQHIFLETAATKTNTGFQKLVPNCPVSSNSMSHFLYVSPRGFTDSRDGVDAGDSLGKEGIGC